MEGRLGMVKLGDVMWMNGIDGVRRSLCLVGVAL